MGRTLRRRTRKTRPNVNLSSDSSFIKLTQWMSKRGWTQTTSLSLSKFKETGRGLMARKNIEQGDVLVSIPRSLLITTATVFESPVGGILGQNIPSSRAFLCQEILAGFLLWEKHLGNASTWDCYIKTLPKSFSTPHNLEKTHIHNFPWFLQEHAINNIELVRSCFIHLTLFFNNYVCSHCQHSASNIFAWDDFLWAWCCVNTRAVFIDPENVPPHSLSIKDRNCLALAPYLDMFNHSDAVQVKVGVNSLNNCYEIVSLQPIKKYKEVFINYGPHANSKLFLEYGFVLPFNLHDTIPIHFNQLREVLGEAGIIIQNEYKKSKFCEKHELINQLYISKGGLSWNCSTVLKILLSNSDHFKDWQQISFKGESCENSCDNLKAVQRGILRRVCTDLSKCQSVIFSNCQQACCIFLGEGEKHPALEMCGMLIQCLKSVLKAASLADDCGTDL